MGSSATALSYAGSYTENSTLPRSSTGVDATAILMRAMAVAAAVSATAAHAVPTLGYVRTALSDASVSGDPPDLSGIMPWSWVNTVSSFARPDTVSAVASASAELQRLRRYEDGWNGPRSRGAVAASFDNAEKFLRDVKLQNTGATVSATIFAHGNAALEIEGEGFSALLEFSADGSVYGAVDAAESFDFDVPASVDRLPVEFLSLI